MGLDLGSEILALAVVRRGGGSSSGGGGDGGSGGGGNAGGGGGGGEGGVGGGSIGGRSNASRTLALASTVELGVIKISRSEDPAACCPVHLGRMETNPEEVRGRGGVGVWAGVGGVEGLRSAAG